MLLWLTYTSSSIHRSCFLIEPYSKILSGAPEGRQRRRYKIWSSLPRLHSTVVPERTSAGALPFDATSPQLRSCLNIISSISGNDSLLPPPILSLLLEPLRSLGNFCLCSAAGSHTTSLNDHDPRLPCCFHCMECPVNDGEQQSSGLIVTLHMSLSDVCILRWAHLAV